jgi:hypothetical protein
LNRQKNALGLIYSAHDFEQPLGIRLQHDQIASDFGFEFKEHVFFQIGAVNEHSNS